MNEKCQKCKNKCGSVMLYLNRIINLEELKHEIKIKDCQKG